MLDGAPASGHPETMEPPAVRPAQLQTLRQRRASTQRRLDELAALPARPAAGELAVTRRRALESQLAARRALLSYRDALYRSAQAHDNAAAAADRRKAGQIQALILLPGGEGISGPFRQDIRRPARLDVDQQRAVAPPLAQRDSSTPSTRGAVLTTGPAKARISRGSVIGSRQLLASLTAGLPARPPSASATASSTLVSPRSAPSAFAR